MFEHEFDVVTLNIRPRSFLQVLDPCDSDIPSGDSGIKVHHTSHIDSLWVEQDKLREWWVDRVDSGKSRVDIALLESGLHNAEFQFEASCMKAVYIVLICLPIGSGITHQSSLFVR